MNFTTIKSKDNRIKRKYYSLFLIFLLVISIGVAYVAWNFIAEPVQKNVNMSQAIYYGYADYYLYYLFENQQLEIDTLLIYYLGQKNRINTHPQISEYDYIIGVNGSCYYTLNGYSGRVIYRGVNAQTIIQNTLDIASGKSVYVKQGIYTVYNLQINNSVYIKLDEFAEIRSNDTEANNRLIEIFGENIVIDGGYFNGIGDDILDYTRQNLGITIYNTSDIYIKNSVFDGFRYGVIFWYDCENITIQDCEFVSSLVGVGAIHREISRYALSNIVNNVIITNIVGKNIRNVIYWDNVTTDGLYCENIVGYGVYAPTTSIGFSIAGYEYGAGTYTSHVNNVMLSNFEFYDFNSGIHIEGGYIYNIIISNGIIIGNSEDVSYEGISVMGYDVIVSNIKIENVRYGLKIPWVSNSDQQSIIGGKYIFEGINISNTTEGIYLGGKSGETLQNIILNDIFVLGKKAIDGISTYLGLRMSGYSVSYRYITITNIHIDGDFNHSIYLKTGQLISIGHCILNGVINSNIKLENCQNIIIGDSMINKNPIGIQSTGTSDYIIVHDNIFTNTGTATNLVGSNNNVHDNIG